MRDHNFFLKHASGLLCKLFPAIKWTSHMQGWQTYDCYSNLQNGFTDVEPFLLSIILNVTLFIKEQTNSIWSYCERHVLLIEVK